jgi:hypothetical protein
MPVEIRELIIRTEISGTGRNTQPGVKEKDLTLMKKRLLDECKRMIAANMNRDSYKR